jgi:hypothetical protein
MEFSINIGIDDIISSCSKREKKELYKALLEDGDVLSEKEKMEKKREEQQAEKFHLMQTLEAMSQYELKKTLCNLLGVATYLDEAALRKALEPIIKA